MAKKKLNNSELLMTSLGESFVLEPMVKAIIMSLPEMALDMLLASKNNTALKELLYQQTINHEVDSQLTSLALAAYEKKLNDLIQFAQLRLRQQQSEAFPDPGFPVISHKDQ